MTETSKSISSTYSINTFKKPTNENKNTLVVFYFIQTILILSIILLLISGGYFTYNSYKKAVFLEQNNITVLADNIYTIPVTNPELLNFMKNEKINSISIQNTNNKNEYIYFKNEIISDTPTIYFKSNLKSMGDKYNSRYYQGFSFNNETPKSFEDKALIMLQKEKITE